MKIVFKKIISFFFILLGLTPLLFALFITIKKLDIRHRMKEKLEKQTLQTIMLPENEVIWMDKHEIWINDHMFDIHSKKLENGIYTFSGLYDEEETILVKNEKKAMENDNEENKILSLLFKCLHNIFFSQSGQIDELICLHDYNYSSVFKRPLSPFKEIITPPPQLGC